MSCTAWNYSAIDYAEKIRLVLRENDVPIGTIAENIQIDTGSYAWTVGTYVAGTAPAGTGYTIKIKLYGEAITDKSDGGFTLN